MTRKTLSFDTASVLQVVVALFLFTLGLLGIVDWNSSLSQFARNLGRLFGRPDNPWNLVVAIAELSAGAIIFLALFVTVTSRLIYWVTVVIAVLWIVQIILEFFVQQPFEPDFLTWLNRLSADLVILLGLWLVNRRYA